jgi:ferredoxin-NADP reductase
VPLTTLSVQDVIRATPRTRHLRIDTGGSAFSYRAGQAVMVGLHGSPLRKPYSIASAPSETFRTGSIELLVQVDDSGGPDPHLELAAPGTRLDVEGPFGSFSLPSLDEEPAFLMVAGGTGIAPLRSMMVEALSRPVPQRISLVYSARSVDELAYRAELEALAATGRIVLVMTVTRDDRADWSGRRSRIDRPMLAAALPNTEAWCLLCGPQAMIEDVRASLSSLGVPDSRVGVERYDQ